MKKQVFSLLAGALFITANAQTLPLTSCGTEMTPNGPREIIPDTNEFFTHYFACQGTSYEKYMTFLVPVDTLYDIDGAGPTPAQNLPINYFRIDSIKGLPSGFSWAAYKYVNGTPTASTDNKFNGGKGGCIRIFTAGNVTAPTGTYTATIYLTGNAQVPIIGPYNVNATFKGYKLVVKAAGQCTQGVEEAVANNSIFVAGNYPNPFEQTTTFKVSVPSTQDVTLNVYNTLGQLVKTQVQTLEFGENLIKFDGSSLSNGIYTYTMSSSNAGVISAKGNLLISK